MAAVTSTDQFLDLVHKSELVESDVLNAFLEELSQSEDSPSDAKGLASAMVRAGLITKFQGRQLLLGRWRGFFIQGKYKLMRLLGTGGMARVYLCQHVTLDRLVAVKFLPLEAGSNSQQTKRFYREAKAVAALNHPNIVRVFDIDNADKLHFMVLEYVDGPNLHELVQEQGTLSPATAAQYIYQVAQGLQHAYEAGWVHRDIKPSNLLLDRGGVVKMLDLGLARFFENEQQGELTNDGDNRNAGVVGTVDYLSPEQAISSSQADIRSDIYSLGATLRYLLVGEGQFSEEGSLANKVMWLQTRDPAPVTNYRDDVPAELLAVISKMMAKKPEDRYNTPQEVAEALAPLMGEGAVLVRKSPHSDSTLSLMDTPSEPYPRPDGSTMGAEQTTAVSPQRFAPDEPSGMLSWTNLTQPSGGSSPALPPPREITPPGGITPPSGITDTLSGSRSGLRESDGFETESVFEAETHAFRKQEVKGLPQRTATKPKSGDTEWEGLKHFRAGNVDGFKQSLAKLPLWVLVAFFGSGWMVAAFAIIIPLILLNAPEKSSTSEQSTPAQSQQAAEKRS